MWYNNYGENMQLFILCIKIFFIRILDVSLGTFRTILTVRGKKLTASLIGFVEVFIWFVIVREALNTDETSLWVAISYALGFSIGTYIGSLLSQKFITGNLGIQVITDHAYPDMVNALRESGYGVTVMDVKGRDIDVDKYMLFIEINNKNYNHLYNLIKKHDPKAFIVVNETKLVQNGYIVNNIVK